MPDADLLAELHAAAEHSHAEGDRVLHAKAARAIERLEGMVDAAKEAAAVFVPFVDEVADLTAAENPLWLAAHGLADALAEGGEGDA